ncbi:MAG: polysaccharide deacetylase family protein [Cyanobacteriota bacterium]
MKSKKIILILSMIFLSSCSFIKILWEDGRKGENTICLTFDDGPNGIATKNVLNVLDKYQVPATFFIIGKNAEREPELLKEISKRGYSIGNHSYDHDNFLFTKSNDLIKENILKTNKIVKSITGKNPNLFRPPNALVNENIEKACNETNMKIVGVNIFINDSMLFNEDVTYSYVMKELKSGINILVLHDGFGTFENQQRVFISDALDRIINKLKKIGYKFGKIEKNGICS